MPVEVAVTNNLHTDHLRQTPTDLRHIARRLQAPADRLAVRLSPDRQAAPANRQYLARRLQAPTDLRHIVRRLQAPADLRHTNRQHLISMANRQAESVLHQRSARHRQAANRQLHQ